VAWPAVTVTSGAAATPAPGTGSLTFSHTCAAADTKLVVLIGSGLTGGGDPITGVTYNGTALSLVSSVGDGSFERAQIWQLNSPPTGSALTVSIQYSTALANGQFGYGAISFDGAAAAVGTPASATGATANPSVTVASAVGDVVVSVLANDNALGAQAVSSGTQIFNFNDVSTDSDFTAQYQSAVGTNTVCSFVQSDTTGGSWVAVGVAVKSATLQPTITSQPSSISKLDGDLAGFAVAASASAGGGSLSYQWQRNGVNITGATADTLAFLARVADSGALFACVVTDSNGSATSASARLTVSLRPTAGAARKPRRRLGSTAWARDGGLDSQGTAETWFSRLLIPAPAGAATPTSTSAARGGGTAATSAAKGSPTTAAGRAGGTATTSAAKATSAASSGTGGARASAAAGKGIAGNASATGGARAAVTASKGGQAPVAARAGGTSATTAAKGSPATSSGTGGARASVSTTAATAAGATSTTAAAGGARAAVSTTKATSATSSGTGGPRATTSATKATSATTSGTGGARASVSTTKGATTTTAATGGARAAVSTSTTPPVTATSTTSGTGGGGASVSTTVGPARSAGGGGGWEVYEAARALKRRSAEISARLAELVRSQPVPTLEPAAAAAAGPAMTAGEVEARLRRVQAGVAVAMLRDQVRMQEMQRGEDVAELSAMHAELQAAIALQERLEADEVAALLLTAAVQ